MLGGSVVGGHSRECGRAEIEPSPGGRLFLGLSGAETVWRSHGDRVGELPPGFVTTAASESVPIAPARTSDTQIAVVTTVLTSKDVKNAAAGLWGLGSIIFGRQFSGGNSEAVADRLIRAGRSYYERRFDQMACQGNDTAAFVDFVGLELVIPQNGKDLGLQIGMMVFVPEFKGGDALRRHNKQFRDVVRELRLTDRERDLFHHAVSKQGFTYHELRQIDKDMFGR